MGTTSTITIPKTKNGVSKPPNCLERKILQQNVPNQKNHHTEYSSPPKAGPVLIPNPTKVSKIPYEVLR